MKQKKKGNPIAQAIILLIVALVFVVLSVVINTKQLFGKATDINELLGGNLKNDDFVSVHVDAVLGNYAQMKHTWNFIPVGTDQYYVIWLDDDSFISIKTDNKQTIKKLEEICDEFWEAYDNYEDLPEGIVLTGTVSTTDSKILGYYKEALSDIGVIKYGYDVDYRTIDCTRNTKSAWITVGIFGLMLVGAIINMVVTIKKKKNDDAMANFAAQNAQTVQDNSAELDAYMNQFEHKE